MENVRPSVIITSGATLRDKTLGIIKSSFYTGAALQHNVLISVQAKILHLYSQSSNATGVVVLEVYPIYCERISYKHGIEESEGKISGDPSKTQPQRMVRL